MPQKYKSEGSREGFPGFFYICGVHPDHPHKRFGDKRIAYSLLMQTLAMQSPA